MQTGNKHSSEVINSLGCTQEIPKIDIRAFQMKQVNLKLNCRRRDRSSQVSYKKVKGRCPSSQAPPTGVSYCYESYHCFVIKLDGRPSEVGETRLQQLSHFPICSRVLLKKSINWKCPFRGLSRQWRCKNRRLTRRSLRGEV